MTSETKDEFYYRAAKAKAAMLGSAPWMVSAKTVAAPIGSNFEIATRQAIRELRDVEDQIEGLEARKAWLRENLLEALASGEDRAATLERVGTATVLDGKTTAIIDDPKLVPAKFWVNPAPSIDATAVAKALRAGGEVSGARLSEPGKSSLRVVWVKP